MKVNEGDWKPITMGSRKEHLLKLDDGLTADKIAGPYAFDHVLEETYDTWTQRQDNKTGHNPEHYTLWHYLELTGQPPPDLQPEEALHGVDQAEPQETASECNETTDPSDMDDDDTTHRRALTDKLVRTLRLHQQQQQQQQALHRKATTDEVLAAHATRKMQFWEIYSGNANLATAMAKKGYQVKTFDLLSGWDFTKPSHQRDFIHLFYHAAPEVIWIAPPCTKWSPIQRLNIKTEADRERLEAQQEHEEGTHLRFSKTIHNKQRKQQRVSLFEHPRYAQSWETQTLQQLEGYDAHIDQCQYGATMPDHDGIEQYIRKPTRLRVTHELLAEHLERICADDHYHLPLEGSSPNIGNRAAAAGSYHPMMCEQWSNILHDFMQHEFWPDTTTEAIQATAEAAAAEQTGTQVVPFIEQDDDQIDTNTGILTRLQETQLAAARRTVQRLHRNLGHPTNLELVKVLKTKNASASILLAAKEHTCQQCDAHRAPAQVAKSTLRTGGSFNTRVQADTVWIHPPRQHGRDKPPPIPVLSIVDTMTKFMAARILSREQSEHLIQAFERGWTRFFGPPAILQLDDHRGWASEALRTWASDHGTELEIAPGQAHTRLSVVERRHQVLRRGIELFLAHQPEVNMTIQDQIARSLCYVVPQINNTPNVQGFSATQWAMGMQPRVPAIATPSEAMEQKLHQAAIAVIEADNDARLRRALLRQRQAIQYHYSTGQRVYYWRDAPGRAGPKLRWKGPAVVVMTEPGRTGPTTVQRTLATRPQPQRRDRANTKSQASTGPDPWPQHNTLHGPHQDKQAQAR